MVAQRVEFVSPSEIRVLGTKTELLRTLVAAARRSTVEDGTVAALMAVSRNVAAMFPALLVVVQYTGHSDATGQSRERDSPSPISPPLAAGTMFARSSRAISSSTQRPFARSSTTATDARHSFLTHT